MVKSNYFYIDELIQSQTADKYHIPNKPSPEDEKNLFILMSRVLDKLRLYIKCPVFVSSGYRSERLNCLVGGSSTSDHMRGMAADVYCKDKQNTCNIFNWLISDDCSVDYDQAIYYPDKNILHISYRSEEANRHMAFVKRS